MGVQASAVKEMGLTDVSTTFLTGTLTGLVSSLVSPGQDTPYGLRRFGVLIGLAAGAGLCGLLVATAAAASRPCRWPPSSLPWCWLRCRSGTASSQTGGGMSLGGVSMSP